MADDDKERKEKFRLTAKIVEELVAIGKIPHEWVLKDGANQHVLPHERDKIRKLADFDLTMLISEINDHGWNVARKTLKMMPEGRASK